jgi:hypothetical protein
VSDVRYFIGIHIGSSVLLGYPLIHDLVCLSRRDSVECAPGSDAIQKGADYEGTPKVRGRMDLGKCIL